MAENPEQPQSRKTSFSFALFAALRLLPFSFKALLIDAIECRRLLRYSDRREGWLKENL